MTTETFKSTDGEEVVWASPIDQLKIGYILQRHRDVWRVIPSHPYLAIDFVRVQALMSSLGEFVLLPSTALLWHNLRPSDFAARMVDMLVGGGTSAGFGARSEAFVRGKANAAGWFLQNWNPPLYIGMAPWVAAGTHCIAVQGDGVYQHEFGDLVVVNKKTRPQSRHVDFTNVCDLRDAYNARYLGNHAAGREDLDDLVKLLDQTFEANQPTLAAADAFHRGISVGMVSSDYEPPVLSKYERLAHDSAGKPGVQVSFALLHYERAIKDFNRLKAAQAGGDADEALAMGVNCVVSAAATVEAMANRLVFESTGAHPSHKDRRQPVAKIDDSGAILAARAGGSFSQISSGRHFAALDDLRQLRNDFMHAKELDADIDPVTSVSELRGSLSEAACRRLLAAVRQCAADVFAQLPNTPCPIVTRGDVIWLGDLEVP